MVIAFSVKSFLFCRFDSQTSLSRKPISQTGATTNFECTDMINLGVSSLLMVSAALAHSGDCWESHTHLQASLTKPSTIFIEVGVLKPEDETGTMTESYCQRHPIDGLITFTCSVEHQNDQTVIKINDGLKLVKVEIGLRLILKVIFNPLTNGPWKRSSTKCVSGHQSPIRPDSDLSLTVKLVTSSMRAIDDVRQRALVVWSTLNTLHLSWLSLRHLP